MAYDENIAATADKISQARSARPAPPGPAMPEEEEAPAGIAEVRSLLQQAMDLLDSMEGGGE